jgi:gliding motility-associated-like protein
MKFRFKKSVITFAVLLLSVVMYSQDQRTCGTSSYMQEKMQNPSFAKKQKLKNLKYKEALERVQSGNVSAQMATLIIPVAVHFPEGSEADRLCLEALAQSQVDVLNQDYTATNPDISNWAAASGFYPNTTTGAFDVEFVLATRNHPADTDDDLVEGGPAVSIGYNFGNGNDQDIKWAGYKNFLVKTISGGILGYSPLGGSIANGAAVVMAPFAFGSDAIAPGCSSNGIDFIPGAPYNLGRTVTHELGHYFTLNHTFNGGCAGNNDGYNDTPAIPDANYGCPADGSVDGCVAGEKALTMNYMDYVNDACMWMFSQDQVDAMQAYWLVEEGDLLTDVVSMDYVLLFDSQEINVCNSGAMQYTFDYDADDSFSTQVDFTYSVNPAGPVVNFSQNNATSDTADITATVTGATPGNYTITVTGTYGTEVQNYELTLNVFNGAPNTPALVTPVNGATGVADYTLTWATDATAVSYDVEIATDSGFTNIIEGPVSVNTNQYTATMLDPLTEYFWRVTATNTCATSGYSTVNSFTTDVCSVCPSVANTDWATSTTRVVFNTIDNASGKPSGYSDYTSISTDVLINNSYDLTINANTDGAYTTKTIVWIDWNQNCVFDVPSEEYDLGDAYDTADGATDLSALSITVPAGAVIGNTIMRVTTKFKADGLQTSCENSADAEVEDYTINVLDPTTDTDMDTIPDISDNCPYTANTDQADWNNNGIGDVCDDTDSDGIFDDVDNCIETPNPGQEDMENDGVGDACQVYDADSDGILDDVDNCVNTANPDQADVDNNGIGDACQDTDADGVLDINDNCVNTSNPGQEDADNNGIGDACQDTDSDGVIDIDDNCPFTSNSDQLDLNNNNVGDVCESIIPADTVTPNGDFQNDTWHIENIEYQTSNTVKVFNRWGVKVFGASNYVNDSWGAESSEGGSGLLPSGSYYFVIEYVTGDGEAKTMTGWMYINY